MDVKDVAVRAVKTFVEVLLVAVPAEVLFGSDPLPVVRAGLLSAAAAGVAVIWNALLQWARSQPASEG